ncbi:phytoene desaturase family protein [Barrientosiimonas humi]|uniref:phytoene desaturase family protein n=1 Tax=Barrientosiimonas humi TaxID=999931 RepID=UPI00370D8D69
MEPSAPSTPDAVVIGAGPNGLVAANLLADAGWSVLLLEAQPDIGGAVRSTREVHPAYVHDTFSSFYPLGAASPIIRGLGLEDHGLVWEQAPAPFGTPYVGGGWALVHRDREATAEALERQHPGDGRAWLRLCRQWDRVGPSLVGALLSPFPPVRHGLGLLARLPGAGGLGLVRELLSPVRTVLDSELRGTAPRLLLAGNALHADIPLDSPGSGLMGLLLTMLAQDVGFPVPRGGAGQLTGAMGRRLEQRGGQLRTDARVEQVLVERGRAVGVRLAGGEVVRAGRAVLADVSAPALYGDLVAPDQLPDRVLRAMRRFEWDPATVKVDWALDGPIPWASAPEAAPGTVHVLDSIDDLHRFETELRAGHVSDRPYLVMGQMATADPTRAPAGGESVWAYTHVPQDARSGPPGFTGRWDEADKDLVAGLFERRIAELAPGFADRVVARRVLGPPDLQARDANLVGGALGGGTAALQQQLIFRPVPGWGRAETPVGRLFLASASAHPGGGVHGAPGANAARAALLHARLPG